jgi:hypothetical protein
MRNAYRILAEKVGRVRTNMGGTIILKRILNKYGSVLPSKYRKGHRIAISP